MFRSLLSLCLCVFLFACNGDSLPTAVDSQSGASASDIAKSPRIDGAPISPVFFNALNPVPFAEVKEWPDWVPIIFYRDMACVPHDINFLSSEFDLRSVSCRSRVDGFMIWPDDSSALPQVVVERATEPVDMWFVTMEDWYAAAEDDIVGWDELRAAPSFREGIADFYHARHNFVAQTFSRDIRGSLSAAPDTRFRMHFVGRLVFHDDGSFTEVIPRFIVNFY